VGPIGSDLRVPYEYGRLASIVRYPPLVRFHMARPSLPAAALRAHKAEASRLGERTPLPDMLDPSSNRGC
jgi:hypothetical protein